MRFTQQSNYDLFIIHIKLATIVESDQKAPFSIATTPRCSEGRYSFPWIAPLYPWYVPYRWVLSKEVSSTILKVFGMTRPRIEPRSPGPLANTLPTLISLVGRVFANTRKYQVPLFESLLWLDLRMNPGLPGLWRTLYH